MPDGKVQKKDPREKKRKFHSIPYCWKSGWAEAPIPATRISPRAGSAPLAGWQGLIESTVTECGFPVGCYSERRLVTFRTLGTSHHQLPHDQSRRITCTLYCHVGQARYLPQTTNFMCHDEDVATYCLFLRHGALCFLRSCVGIKNFQLALLRVHWGCARRALMGCRRD